MVAISIMHTSFWTVCSFCIPPVRPCFELTPQNRHVPALASLLLYFSINQQPASLFLLPDYHRDKNSSRINSLQPYSSWEYYRLYWCWSHWGTVYLVGIFSCAWGFLAGMIGFGLGGWAWALLLGILALISGVKVHLRDLKRPFVNKPFEQFDSNKWRQNWNLGTQNLN